jgi:predicted PolB exonuclease-like 3'-5' exonuclease
MGIVELTPRVSADAAVRTAFLVVDTESIPDGRLLSLVKYPGQELSDEAAIEKARVDQREVSWTGSDFLPLSFQIPVAVCVVRVAADYSIQAIKCLDAPQFRPREIVSQFWSGVQHYHNARLVTFNGRAFDMPLLELAAFRYGVCLTPAYVDQTRNRFRGTAIDLLDWLTNHGAARLAGGLNLLAKLLGKPGKMEVSGEQVYAMHREGRHQEINDYCMFDTLDTYFVFLRTCVMRGEISLEQEAELSSKAKNFLASKSDDLPALGQYLANWSDWQPWP